MKLLLQKQSIQDKKLKRLQIKHDTISDQWHKSDCTIAIFLKNIFFNKLNLHQNYSKVSARQNPNFAKLKKEQTSILRTQMKNLNK